MKNSLFITEENIDNSIIKKEEEYMGYIKNHISNVIKVFENMVENIHIFRERGGYDDIIDAISEAENEGFIYRHDDSKYSDEEFGPYRRYWHPVSEQEKEEAEEEFQLAWKHHYTVNAHHPEYWIKNNIPQPMEPKYVVELICDWIAMSMVKGGSVLEYWENNRDKKQKVMHKDTMELIDKILNIYDPRLLEAIANSNKEEE